MIEQEEMIKKEKDYFYCVMKSYIELEKTYVALEKALYNWSEGVGKTQDNLDYIAQFIIDHGPIDILTDPEYIYCYINDCVQGKRDFNLNDFECIAMTPDPETYEEYLHGDEVQ